MAKATKHEAVLPDGTIAKRTSQSRKYSHCVAFRGDGEAILAGAKADTISKTDRSNFAYHAAYLDGTSQWLARKGWETDEVYAQRCADDIARANRALKGAKTAEEWFEADKAARVAKIEADLAAGHYDKWSVAGWNGRYDLAVKLAQATSGPWVRDVTILEAILKE